MVNKATERRIGVLGGTFDPVHTGHLLIAQKSKELLELDEVIFIPAGQPVFKSDIEISAAQHRLEMLLIATSETPYFNVSTIEIERPGPSYTVDTLVELEAGFDRKTEVYLLVGYDAIIELPSWKEPARLVELCYLVAVKRPGFDEVDVKSLEEKIPGISDRIIYLNAPCIDISSTEIRTRVEQGMAVGGLVPDSVEHYIAENGLYLKGAQ